MLFAISYFPSLQNTTFMLPALLCLVLFWHVSFLASFLNGVLVELDLACVTCSAEHLCGSAIHLPPVCLLLPPVLALEV